MNSKILIVDNESMVCEELSNFLEFKGYDTLTATNGQQALSKLLLEAPDLILLDIQMPGMNGIECLSKIRKLDKDIPVIMVTVITDEDIAKKAMESGATDYLTKPICFEALQKAILVYILLKSPS